MTWTGPAEWKDLEDALEPKLAAELMDGYKDPTYPAGACSRCGARVRYPDEGLHGRHHRAVTLVIAYLKHMVLKLLVDRDIADVMEQVAASGKATIERNGVLVTIDYTGGRG